MVKDNKTISKFWIAFFAVLSALFLATAIFTFITLSQRIEYQKATTVDDENIYKIRVENDYQQSVFQVMDDLKNIDASLGKIAVSHDNAKQLELLMETAVYAGDLNAELSRLPVNQGVILEAVEKFTNQLCSYCKSLVRKIGDGDDLSITDKTALKSLGVTTKGIYNALNELVDENMGMYITNSLFTDGANTIGNGIDGMDEKIFRYEELVYDGPFSDNVEDRCVKGNGTAEVEDGYEIVKKMFSKEVINGVEYVGEMKNRGVVRVYDVDTDLGNIRVMLTTDGELVELNYYQENVGNLAVYSNQQAMEIAEQFANELDFDVKAIYTTKSQENITYVSLAPIIDDVICYPDLVKVAVDVTNGKVVGAETRGYLVNHIDRNLTFNGDGSEFVDNFEGTVTKTDKAVITRHNSEYLCYQYTIELPESRYLVYVNQETGREMEILKLLEDMDGYSVI